MGDWRQKNDQNQDLRENYKLRIAASMRRCSLTICATQDFPIWVMVPKIYQELYFC